MISGLNLFLSLSNTSSINPFTLLLHLTWAISISAWVLNLRTSLIPEKRALLAVGVAVAIGSVWTSLQQWMAYLQDGTVSDIFLVAGAMAMDGVGGAVTYILYHLNILKKQLC